MDFTYQAYKLCESFQTYHEAQNDSRCVVMCHDIDL